MGARPPDQLVVPCWYISDTCPSASRLYIFHSGRLLLAIPVWQMGKCNR